MLNDKIEYYQTYLDELYEKKYSIMTDINKDEEAEEDVIHDEYFNYKSKRSLKGKLNVKILKK